VPSLLRDVRRLAEGDPDVARPHAGVERLASRAPTELSEHQVVHDDPAVPRAELGIHGELELAELHGTSGNGSGRSEDRPEYG
jgi:hypothetical protein